MRIARICMLLFALALSAAARANEPPPVVSDESGAETASQNPDEPAAAPDATVPPAQPAREAASERDDRFKPSEKISEDLSVSFPADI